MGVIIGNVYINAERGSSNVKSAVKQQTVVVKELRLRHQLVLGISANPKHFPWIFVGGHWKTQFGRLVSTQKLHL